MKDACKHTVLVELAVLKVLLAAHLVLEELSIYLQLYTNSSNRITIHCKPVAV